MDFSVSPARSKFERCFLRFTFLLRSKVHCLPSFVSLSCSTRKSRADHPWSARSPDKSSTGLFANLRLTLRFAFLLHSEVQGRPSVVCAFAGQIHSLSSPCFALAPAQAFRGLGVRRGGDLLDHRQCSVSPTGPFENLRLTRGKHAQRSEGSLDLRLVPLCPCSTCTTCPAGQMTGGAWR